MTPYEVTTADRAIEFASNDFRALRLWACLALAFHVMLALSWLFTSWVPWIKPQRETQFLISILGAMFHGWIIRQSMKDVRRYFAGLSMFHAIPYLLASIGLYVLTFYFSASMIYRDEVRHKSHLDHVNDMQTQ